MTVTAKDAAALASVLTLLLGFVDARCTASENRAMYELKAAANATCWELAVEN